MEINFISKYFNDLTVKELYRILHLRSEVFVVEQNCVYNDCDNKDLLSYHVLGLNSEYETVAYTRIIPKGISYKDGCSIGRVVSIPEIRGKGTGKKLMEFSILESRRIFPKDKIIISAQTYLESFYTSLGFKSSGNTYLEDGIPHIHMELSCISTK